jgi:sporulation integral membrane protein YlbJ
MVMLRWPQALANGVSRGLSVCSAVIIPTLYPFMILAGILTDSPLCTRPNKFMGAITQRLFCLPACCGTAILLSFVGGYPAGAIAIGQLREKGHITANQAQRMTLFCVNGGPGFIVSTVGAGLLGSTRAGWLLFSAHAITSFGMGILLGRQKRIQNVEERPAAVNSPRPFARTVQDTCGALLTMCGFVVLATAGLSVWEASGLPAVLQSITHVPATTWSTAAATLTEVSCGCIAIVGGGTLAPFWLCLCLGWGGLSVQGQLAIALKGGGERILTKTFWLGRLLHGGISGLIATLLFYYIPVDLPTITRPDSTPFYASPSASVMLLLLSFTAMLCFYPKKTGKMSQDVL